MRTLVRRSPPSGEGGCDGAIQSGLAALDCFACARNDGAGGGDLTISLSPRPRSGRFLLAQTVDELDQLDGRLPVLVGGGMEAFLLTVRQLVEGSLVLGRRFDESVGDGRLEVVGQIRT